MITSFFLFFPRTMHFSFAWRAHLRVKGVHHERYYFRIQFLCPVLDRWDLQICVLNQPVHQGLAASLALSISSFCDLIE